MLDRIDFLVSEALTSLRRNLLMTGAAVTTVAVSLFLIGGFGYLYIRANAYVATLPSQFQMRVYLNDSATEPQIEALSQQLKTSAIVSNVEWISKTKAWQKMLQDHPNIPPEIENPLPNAFNITFKTLDGAQVLAGQLQSNSAVDRVLYQPQLKAAIEQVLGLIRYVGYFGLVLFAIGGVLVYNAIRLTVFARRLEIRVMSLVGASSFTIRTPFMLEGMVQGLLGGLVAVLLLAAANRAIGARVAQIGLRVPAFPVAPLMLWLVLIGGGLGLVCSALAVNAPQKAA